MSEELTFNGTDNGTVSDTDKLAESITEMINAVSNEHPAPAVEEKELPAMPPELERMLNEDLTAPDIDEEEVPSTAEVTEDTPSEPASEEDIPADSGVVNEIAEESAEEAKDEVSEPAEEPSEEILSEEAEEVKAQSEATAEAPDTGTEAAAEEPAVESESATEEPAEDREEVLCEPAPEEAEPVTEQTDTENNDESEEASVTEEAEPVAASVQEDMTATDPEALFVKAPPSDGSRYLLTPDTDADGFRNAIAGICDNIRVYLPEKKGCSVIAVTSSGRGEGKSSFALLLAMALASGRRVLLADCDFYAPQLHKYFNCVNKKGVLNLSEGECRPEEVALNTDIPDLKFMTSGLLEEGRVPDPLKVVTGLKDAADFDVVICDLPSVNKSGYAAFVAGASDGTVIVARSGVTSYPSLARAVRKLKKADANLLGAVLNG